MRRILLNIVFFLLLVVCAVRISFYVPRLGVERAMSANYGQGLSAEQMEVKR